MLMTQQTNNKSVTAVLGIGVTGLSVARFLQQRGDAFVVCDTRSEPPMLTVFKQEFPATICYLGEQCEQALSSINELVVSPGLNPKHPMIVNADKQGVKIIGDIELFARHVNAPVVAITGSNGKSTVTELLGEMSRMAMRNVAVGGNLGTPALSLLAADRDLYILELSSFQLELVDSLRPEVATILNISADHLDRYQSMSSYTAAKQRIYQAAKLALVNGDDKATYPSPELDLRMIEFSLSEPVEGAFGIREIGEAFFLTGPNLSLPVAEMALQGKHNWANALAALAMGVAVGLPMDAMLTTLRTFTGLPHRCQFVARVGGVKYINDSKATNVGSALAAIEGLGLGSRANLIWIAGGVGKGAEFEVLKDAVAKHVKKALLLGEDAEKLAAALADTTDIEIVTDLNQAVVRANELAMPDDVVLLSPACASLDMFTNFEARGECFQRAVETLQ
jgi:UDP-N-acetylmuramoylalanine--D-glutamate ligase